MKIHSGLLVVAGLSLVAAVIVAGQPSHRHLLMEHTLVPETIASLGRADAVAVIRPAGLPVVHWNNSTNTEWHTDSMAAPAMTYRDEPVEVVRTIRGHLPEAFSLRGVGGTVGNVTLELETSTPLQDGKTYLVFLSQEETPVEGGTETAWTVTGLDQGVFSRASDGRWRNTAGDIEVAESELEE